MQRLPLFATLLLAANSCRCPQPKEPTPPPPAKIVEVVKPCSVDLPSITLIPTDIPDPDANGQITLTKDALIRLAQSIFAWESYVRLTKEKCGAQ